LTDNRTLVQGESRRWSPHEHRTYVSAAANPFAASPLRRHAWAFDQLRFIDGPHLDVGSNRGVFAAVLSGRMGRWAVGVDVDAEEVGALRKEWPELPAVVADGCGRLPFAAGCFGSVSLLDVLEHVADEGALLREAYRVVRPGGTVVVSVPGRHTLSCLDPDDFAFRFPRAHRRLWSLRYGRALYRSRFVAKGSQVRGDIATGRGGHTNYRPGEVAGLLRHAGLELDRMEGSGLFFRLLQIPALAAPASVGLLFDRALVADANRFAGPPGKGLRRRANIFAIARRPVGQACHEPASE
jgi:SAM-dependent methyltransferase